jgi:hypothetical protein
VSLGHRNGAKRRPGARLIGAMWRPGIHSRRGRGSYVEGDLLPALLPVEETVQDAQALRHGENYSSSTRGTKEAGARNPRPEVLEKPQ